MTLALFLDPLLLPAQIYDQLLRLMTGLLKPLTFVCCREMLLANVLPLMDKPIFTSRRLLDPSSQLHQSLFSIPDQHRQIQ